MIAWKLTALSVAAVLAAGSAWAEDACRREIKPVGRPRTFPSTLDEPARLGLSAAVLITLGSDKPNWPLDEISKQTPCPIDSFTASGATYTLSGGTEWVPPRFARAEGRQDYVFLAAGLSPEEGHDWFVKSPRAAQITVKRPTFYLTLVRERARQVLRVYDGFPAAHELKADMAAAIEQRLERIAVYIPGCW